MSMFTLAISYLTTSNLPWFMALTFQVPMQYCSLQHWTLIPSLVTPKTQCCFCFGSISSLFLELFLYWSPAAYWEPTNLGSSSFRVLSFFHFHTVHGVLKARTMVCHFLFQWTTFIILFTDYTKDFDCADHNKLWKILKEMGVPD